MKFSSLNLFKLTLLRRFLSLIVGIAFLATSLFPNEALAQTVFNLPASSTMGALSQAFTPSLVRGITLYPDNPLKFDFVVDVGDDHLSGDAFQKESMKLIKYFLVSLTIPENDMWVNLNPSEKDRIIPEQFGKTEMGRDLLMQDYILKQLTASLMNPQEKLGAEFWNQVYQVSKEKFGITDIPTETFNKVWIIPDKAEVYVKGQSVFVVGSHLKVMMEEDYKNQQSAEPPHRSKTNVVNPQTEIMKQIILPAIEREVNEGKNFAQLRQIQNSAILAAWYKKNLKETLLGKVYVDQKKMEGIDSSKQNAPEEIYNQYLEVFKKGVYDFVKEDYDSDKQEVVTRKYISGGIVYQQPVQEVANSAMSATTAFDDRNAGMVSIVLQSQDDQATIPEEFDAAMSIDSFKSYQEIKKIVEDRLHGEKGILFLEGVSGNGKTFMGKFIKEHGLGQHTVEKITFIDIDDYLQVDQVWGMDFEVDRLKETLEKVQQQSGLVVLAGVYIYKFMEAVKAFYENDQIVRIMLEVDPLVNRQRLLQRQGNVDFIAETKEAIEESMVVLQDIPVFPIDDNAPLIPEEDLVKVPPSDLGVVFSEKDGSLKEERSFLIDSKNAFNALNNIIFTMAQDTGLSVTAQPGRLSKTEYVIGSVFAVIRNLYMMNQKKLHVTLRRYERGIRIIIESDQDPLIDSFSLLRDYGTISHVDLIAVNSQEGHGRLSKEMAKKEWVPSQGSRYIVGMHLEQAFEGKFFRFNVAPLEVERDEAKRIASVSNSRGQRLRFEYERNHWATGNMTKIINDRGDILTVSLIKGQPVAMDMVDAEGQKVLDPLAVRRISDDILDFWREEIIPEELAPVMDIVKRAVDYPLANADQVIQWLYDVYAKDPEIRENLYVLQEVINNFFRPMSHHEFDKSRDFFAAKNIKLPYQDRPVQPGMLLSQEDFNRVIDHFRAIWEQNGLDKKYGSLDFWLQSAAKRTGYNVHYVNSSQYLSRLHYPQRLSLYSVVRAVTHLRENINIHDAPEPTSQGGTIHPDSESFLDNVPILAYYFLERESGKNDTTWRKNASSSGKNISERDVYLWAIASAWDENLNYKTAVTKDGQLIDYRHKMRQKIFDRLSPENRKKFSELLTEIRDKKSWGDLAHPLFAQSVIEMDTNDPQRIFDEIRGKDLDYDYFLDDSIIKDRSFEPAIEDVSSSGDLILTTEGEERLKVYNDALTEDIRFFDSGMGAESLPEAPGGIDLNPNETLIQEQGDKIKLPVLPNSADWQNFQTNGFIPVIINVTPPISLPLYLKAAAENERKEPVNVSLLDRESLP